MPLKLDRKPTFRELFDQTGDIRHVVSAIGQSPDNPPAWAIEACKHYYFQRQIVVESLGGGAPPKHPIEDGLLLDKVATLMVEEGFSLTAAVRKVSGQDSEGTDFRRLMRTWKTHLIEPRIRIDGAKPVKVNKWLLAAKKRHFDRFMDDCLAQAVAEIKAGNLSLEITDQAAESERLKKVRALPGLQ